MPQVVVAVSVPFPAASLSTGNDKTDVGDHGVLKIIVEHVTSAGPLKGLARVYAPGEVLAGEKMATGGLFPARPLGGLDRYARVEICTGVSGPQW